MLSKGLCALVVLYSSSIFSQELHIEILGDWVGYKRLKVHEGDTIDFTYVENGDLATFEIELKKSGSASIKQFKETHETSYVIENKNIILGNVVYEIVFIDQCYLFMLRDIGITKILYKYQKRKCKN